MDIKNATLAFAGMFQAIELVRQISEKGMIKSEDQDAFQVSINSVLQLDAVDSESIYNGIGGLRLGLKTLIKHFGYQDSNRSVDVLRYIIGLHVLERKLNNNPEMLTTISETVNIGILEQEISETTQDENEEAFDMIQHLADLYSETLSTFNYRIKVNGKNIYLKNPKMAAQIRALLLAGIRSAVLWRQKGGGRFQVFFKRKKIIAKAEQLYRLANN